MNSATATQEAPIVGNKDSVRPETPIEGFVRFTPSTGHKSKDKRRATRYLPGLCVPGMAMTRGSRGEPGAPIVRNRMLLPDDRSFSWFLDMYSDTKIGALDTQIRVHVVTLFKDNVAFIRPCARSYDHARAEWQAKLLDLRNNVASRVAVKNREDLAVVVYTRMVELRGGTLVCVLPDACECVVMDDDGYYYHCKGADRLKDHIGRAGTAGMIIDRDVEAVISSRMLHTMSSLQQFLNDPKAIKF